MFQGKSFVCRVSCRVAIVFAVTFGFAQCASNAQTFAPPINVSGDNSNAAEPQISVDSHGNIDVIWLDDASGTAAVFFSRSSDGGHTFSAPLNISNHPGSPADSERVATDAAGNIYVVWSEDSSGAHTIFFSRSTDNGMSFSAAQAVSQNSMGTDPAIAIDSSGGVNLLWTDKSNGQRTVFFSRSTNEGVTFSPPVLVSTAEAGSGSPHLITDPSGNRYVVWTQKDTGINESVFFSRGDISGSDPHRSPSPQATLFARASAGVTAGQLSDDRLVTNAPIALNIPKSSRAEAPGPGTSLIDVVARKNTAASTSNTNGRETQSDPQSPQVPAIANTCDLGQSPSNICSARVFAYSINSTQYVDCVHYSCVPDIGAGIDAACSALPPSGGTIVVSLGSATETVLTTIGCGNASMPVTFEFDPATVLQPGSPTMTMMSVQPGNSVFGLHEDMSNQPGFSGTAILLEANYRDSSRTSLSHIYLYNPSLTGAGILIKGTDAADQSVAFVSFHDIRVLGFSLCYYFLTAESGWINGNYFSDTLGDGCPVNFYFDATSTTSGSGVNGNTFVNASSEGASTVFAQFSGVGPIMYNSFDNIRAWDDTLSIENTTGNAVGNYFQGQQDGSITDPTKQNVYINGNTGNFATLHAINIISDLGSACTNAELILSAGWGTAASVSNPAGTGQTCRWTITSNGTGQDTNPTLTDKLTNPLPSSSTVCTMQMEGGTGSYTMITQTALSATSPVFTFNGTPSGGNTYTLVRRCGP